ncbi:hypothetical protein ABZ897_07420 [Nonomuraea sp. NPDC046802]|uniref:hypothetical protein n=1 Tax=Nonomuraea sp. NPDC046802 TaxID=3154919 RepID=UPI0033E63E30
MRGKTRAGIVSAVLVAAMAVPVVAMTTAAAQATTAMACELHIGKTSKSGKTIVGFGSQSRDCGTRGKSTLVIQRSRWYGWEDLASKTVTGSGYDGYVRYNCSGAGTHTYRTIHVGRTIGGSPKFKESNRIRVSC